MALFDRLVDRSRDDRIAVHTWAGACFDYAEAQMTRAEIITAFSIVPADEAGLDLVLAKIDGLGTQNAKRLFVLEMEYVCILGGDDVKYTTQAAARTRLGL